MNEQATAYQVNPTGIPSRWLRFLYRVAGLDAGRVYTITLIVPPNEDADPQWSILGTGRIEPEGRRAMFLGQKDKA